jgi:hypothetical protein
MAGITFECPQCHQPANAAGWCTNKNCSSANIAPEQRPAPAEPVQLPDGGSTPART